MTGVLKIYKAGTPIKVPMNTKVVTPDRPWVAFPSTVTLSAAAHKGTMIYNTSGSATPVIVTIPALGELFECKFRAIETTTITDFIPFSGGKLNGVVDQKVRASRTLNNEIWIRIDPNGDITVFGNLNTQ